MDGNGRWARRRLLPRVAGHRKGAETARELIELAARFGVGYLTLFAFSSENWKRPREEVDALLELFLRKLEDEAETLASNDIRLRIIGAREGFPPALVASMQAVEQVTAACTGLQLQVAVDYGGRWDIARAARRLAQQVAAGELAAEDIDPARLAGELSLGFAPDPDLLIRTGGESRVSNFLLWQLAYSELYFTETLWPAFGEAEFARALDWFRQRERRFGAVRCEDARAAGVPRGA